MVAVAALIHGLRDLVVMAVLIPVVAEVVDHTITLTTMVVQVARELLLSSMEQILETIMPVQVQCVLIVKQELQNILVQLAYGKVWLFLLKKEQSLQQLTC